MEKRDRDRQETQQLRQARTRRGCCPLVVKSLVMAHSYYLHVPLSPSTGFGGLRKVFSTAAGNKMRQLRLSLSQDKKKEQSEQEDKEERPAKPLLYLGRILLLRLLRLHMSLNFPTVYHLHFLFLLGLAIKLLRRTLRDSVLFSPEVRRAESVRSCSCP